MTYPLVSTKFGIPAARPVLVARHRLIERLRAGMHARLSLICAPAGFGKTTLGAEWLRDVARPVAWLSLDEADNDPARFLSYLLAALQIVDENAGKATQALLQEPQPPAPNLLHTTLLNELNAISQPFVLAIDDYHLIQTLSIQQMLDFIVEHQPAHMHLVLITREDPPLGLPRLRARGQVTEVRQEDLRFNPPESAEFLGGIMGLGISAQDIAALERRTEGWITGLQLAALSMQGRSDSAHFVQEFTGSNRYVLDYLLQEVFAGQTQEIQNFVLEISILDRFCASLCDAVTQRTGSQEILETLEHANLFIIPLDQSRTWYRYHRLFRDLLRSKLEARGELALNALHLRASTWCENNALLPEAIQHALASADWERALRLLHDANTFMTKRGEIFTLLNWYGQVPERFILASPVHSLDYSWILMLSGQFERAEAYVSYAEEHAGGDKPFLGQVYNARAHLARVRGDLQSMVALSQQALSLLPQEDIDSRCLVSTNLGIAYWHAGKMKAADRAMGEAFETGQATGNRYATVTAILFQAMAMAVRGQLSQANDRFQSLIQQDGMPGFLLGLAYLYLGVLSYEWDDLKQSGEYLHEGIRLAERIQNDELFVGHSMMLARLYIAGENLPAAGDLLDKAAQRVAKGQVSVAFMPRMAAARVQYALAYDDLASASIWARDMADGSDWHSFTRFINTTRAVLLLAQNEIKQARDYLRACYQRASQGGWVYAMITIRCLQALAASEADMACEQLEKALRLAQPGGFLRTFADQGADLEPHLRRLLRRGVMPDYIQRILSIIEARAPKQVLGQLSLVEPLSPRELEVLAHLVSGLTNRQIAEQLIVSTGTVKTHVHNICAKLGAENRTSAAARARELGLV